jgi:Domain of unknown function (DUF4157)
MGGSLAGHPSRQFRQPQERVPAATPGTSQVASHLLLDVQRAAGNQAVTGLIHGLSASPARQALQAKLTVSQSYDSHEQEADRIADRVMRMPKTPPGPDMPGSATAAPPGCVCGGACTDCQQDRHGAGQEEAGPTQLHAKPMGPAGTGSAKAPPIVRAALRSPGQFLDQTSRAYFEPRFRRDFSAVRIHNDAQAVASAGAVTARAYTVGADIVFGAGEFAPGTQRGQWLLAHELAHVVQQSAGRAPAGVLARQPAEEEAREAEEETGHIPMIVPVTRGPANRNVPAHQEEETHREFVPGGTPANENVPGPETEPARDWRPELVEPEYAYTDQGAHTDWSGGADFRERQREANVLRYQLESVPRAVMSPGGHPPDFVTVSPTEQEHSVSRGERFVFEELAGATIRFKPREFHVPAAMEHDLLLAHTPDEEVGLQLAYFPELNQARGALPSGVWQTGPSLPYRYRAPDGTVYHPRLPPGAAIGHVIPDFDGTPVADRYAAFNAAASRRVEIRKEEQQKAKLAEAEAFALKGRKRQQGACRSARTVPKSSGSPASDRHNAYAAYVARDRGYARIRGPKTELTWTTPEGVSYAFDTFNPADLKEVWEVKTQHEWASPLGMAAAPYHVMNFDERIYALEEQRLKGLYLAARCDLRFRYAVDSCELLNGLNQAWQGLPPVVYIPPAGQRRQNC